ncbi:MAG TPA: autorepressor SdpR family transcription factor [Euzebyales bacterium]|nr:autorepressor SdpR family transcription factor [Euzebyales bacterium]
MSVFDALGHPTRRRILELLRDRDMTAGELAEHFDVSKPTLSGHFAKLRDADLIVAVRDGTSIIYSLNLSVVEEALMGLLGRLGSRGDGAQDADRASKEPHHG